MTWSNQPWIGRTELELEGLMLKRKLQYFSHAMRWINSLEKTLMLGKIEGGMTEYEMVRWHQWFNGHEFEQALEDGGGQRSLECCSPWGHKKLDMTEHLNNNNNNIVWTPEFLKSPQVILVAAKAEKGYFWSYQLWGMAPHQSSDWAVFFSWEPETKVISPHAGSECL